MRISSSSQDIKYWPWEERWKPPRAHRFGANFPRQMLPGVHLYIYMTPGQCWESQKFSQHKSKVSRKADGLIFLLHGICFRGMET